MRRCVLALATVSSGGCGFSISFGDSAPNDSMIDAASDGPCATFSTFIDTCDLPQGASLSITGMHTFDTDSGLLTDPIGTVVPVKTATVNLAHNAIDVQAIFIDDLMLDGVLLARGSRPFAIIASGDVELVGNSVIEVGMGGAGAQVECATPAKSGEPDGTGGGGGGGGALGADGGRGGDGDTDGDGSAGADGGVAMPTPTAIIGGCSGGAGGDGDEQGGRGGAGGGAIFVVSATKIAIGGTAGINAGGEGGRGGMKSGGNTGDAGGGGGGSGGTILLEAPQVRNDGTLSANGGGGGEGSDNGGSSGDPGDSALLGTAAALGGDGNSGGGAGGAVGGNSAMPSGGPEPGARPGGGGGGGGSVGFIRIVATQMNLGSKVSPLPVP